MTKKRRDELADSWAESLTTEAPIELVVANRRTQPYFLRQLTGPGAPKDWILAEGTVVIGRSKAADFTVDSPELSRKHIEIMRQGKEYKCIDLESRNGVYLDGVKFHSVILRQGDVIQLGNVSFLFLEGK